MAAVDTSSLEELEQLLLDLNIIASDLDIELPASLVVQIALNCTHEVADATLQQAARLLDLYSRALHATAPQSDIWLETIRNSVGSSTPDGVAATAPDYHAPASSQLQLASIDLIDACISKFLAEASRQEVPPTVSS